MRSAEICQESQLHMDSAANTITYLLRIMITLQ
jgi:hypothetical protein